MKKLFLTTLIGLLVLSASFVSCSKDEDSEKINPDNLFAGTWTDGYSVNIIITETTWTAKVESSTYNSGTYTYEGNTAQWKVTNKGMGSAQVGDVGNATIINGKMTISNFSDGNMNGTYTKKDDNNATGNTNNKESELFVGKWQGQYSGGAGVLWLHEPEFRADGTCTWTWGRKDGFGGGGSEEGVWQYVSESKMLITNIQDYNFEIIVLSEDLWSGKRVSTGNISTFTRIK